MSTTTPTNVFAEIQSTLSTDAQKAVAFLKTAELDVSIFLQKVAQGANIFVADIEAVAAWVAAHITIINSTIAAVGAIAATVAPTNVTVAKTVADLQTAANDVAGLSAALTSGSTVGQPTAVTTAVTAINAINQLSSLASAASQTLGALAANSSTATTTVAPTPAP